MDAARACSTRQRKPERHKHDYEQGVVYAQRSLTTPCCILVWCALLKQFCGSKDIISERNDSSYFSAIHFVCRKDESHWDCLIVWHITRHRLRSWECCYPTLVHRPSVTKQISTYFADYWSPAHRNYWLNDTQVHDLFLKCCLWYQLAMYKESDIRLYKESDIRLYKESDIRLWHMHCLFPKLRLGDFLILLQCG